MRTHADLDPEAPPPVVPSQKIRYLAYLFPVLFFPILLIGLAVVIVPSRWFSLRSGNIYYSDLGYGAELRNQSCEILIYGDSSAMVGIEPAVVQQRTGLTTCNIAEFEGMTLVNETVLVDDFLAHNPRPRFIVFLYSPEDLYLPKSWDKGVSNFEGISYLIKNRPLVEVFRRMGEHPIEFLSWAELGMRMVLTHLRTAPISSEAQHLRDRHMGRLPVPEDTRADCSSVGPPFDPPDPAWIASLRAHYGVDGTRVLVDATPTLACDPGLAFYQKHLDPLIDNSPYLPIDISNYSSDGRLHANSAGVITLSNMVASQIEATHPDQTASAIQIAPSGGR